MGGLRGERALSPNPFEQKALINECLAFDERGQYALRAWSGVVYEGDNAWRGKAIFLQSASVEIEIMFFDPRREPPQCCPRSFKAAPRSNAANGLERVGV